jgi:hypothetical protein
MLRSEQTALSQVRFSEITSDLPDPLPPLVTLDKVKTWFGVTDSTLDQQLTVAIDIVSGVIRRYCGRTFSKANYTEVFQDVMEIKPERYLIEIPIISIADTNIASLLNRKTGRILMTGGPSLSIEYEGGYDPLPSDIVGVAMELIRQQMAAFGVTELGTNSPVVTPAERAVWVGTLKVEYAIGANSEAAKAAGAGAYADAALEPYSGVLDSYKSYRVVMAT